MASIAEERLVFAQTVESLFVRGVAGRLQPKSQQRLKEAGIDVSRPLLPAYLSDVFTHCIGILAEELCPEMAPAAAYHFLGRRTVLGMEETLVGRATMALVRLVGPLRALQAFPKGLKAGSTYSRAVVRVVHPSCVELDVTGYALPYADFQVGTIDGVFEIMQKPTPRSTVLDFKPAQESLNLRIEW